MITDKLQFTIQDAVADSSGQYCWHLDIFVCNVTTSSPTATLIAPGAAILVIGLILISAGVIIIVIVIAVYIQKRKK